MSECTHNCETCSENCSSRDPKSFLAPLADISKVKHVIAIASGKGGVGKSLVTSLIASYIQKRGLKAAILDADITGPSIPKSFGIIENQVFARENLMLPKRSKSGIQIMSANFLLENETDPIIWRGSLISQSVKQFWTDCYWEDVDYMIVDMPPGTGDVPLSVYQFLPVEKVVIVASPQKLVEMIVEKSINMANKMDKKVVGIVENMSYVKCPNCSEKIDIFGKSNIEEIAKANNTELLCKIPMDLDITKKVDAGDVESVEIEGFDKVIEKIIE